MSVINNMLRDLDRRHASAPLPVGASIPIAESRRPWLRPALAVCALAAIIGWGWERHIATDPVATTVESGTITPSPDNGGVAAGLNPSPSPLVRTEENAPSIESGAITPSADKFAGSEFDREPRPQGPGQEVRPDEGRGAEGVSSTQTTGPKPKTGTAPAPLIRGEENAAPIVKQAHDNPDLTAERYAAARTALAQGSIQQAYDLLRDNPPPLAAATDYHAVLAAAEQQLGHYADAAARYRQLLQRDATQASWWLGLALALDGAGNRAEAQAGFERALALDTLPTAARDYAASRAQILENHSGR